MTRRSRRTGASKASVKARPSAGRPRSGSAATASDPAARRTRTGSRSRAQRPARSFRSTTSRGPVMASRRRTRPGDQRQANPAMSARDPIPYTPSRNSPRRKKSSTGVFFSQDSFAPQIRSGRIGDERDTSDEPTHREHPQKNQQRPHHSGPVPPPNTLWPHRRCIRSLRHLHRCHLDRSAMALGGSAALSASSSARGWRRAASSRSARESRPSARRAMPRSMLLAMTKSLGTIMPS
jgi:hypothetical protein